MIVELIRYFFRPKLFTLCYILLSNAVLKTLAGEGRNNVLVAHFSENSLQGSIWFRKGSLEDVITVVAFVNSTDGSAGDKCSWAIRQLPVDYTSLDQRCTNHHLGPIRSDLDIMLGLLTLNKEVRFSISANVLSITGRDGIWLSSIILDLSDGRKACSTLIASEETDVKIGAVRFNGPIFGTVYFYWVGIIGSTTDAVIVSHLQHLHKGNLVNSNHKWGIFVTDILDTRRDKTKLECSALQSDDIDLNDLSSKLGKLIVGKKAVYRDPSLSPIDLYQNEHVYYVAIYDDVHKDSFLNCAPIILFQGIELRSHVQVEGDVGNVLLKQMSPFDPTFVSVTFNSSTNQLLGGFRIHSLPTLPNYYKYGNDKCFGIKDVFNPTNKGIGADAAFPGNFTQDMYAVGDISGKLGYEMRKYWDLFLPLYGRSSVLHRTFVFYKNSQVGVEVPWLCELLLLSMGSLKLPLATAEVVFQYPLSGRIIFRQQMDNEFSDTVVIVESLIYSDGSTVVDSEKHNWTINVNPPNKDFYDWQNRCLSTGDVYNPFKLSGRTDYGDINTYSFAHLSSIVGTLSIAGKKQRAIEFSRDLFIASSLPLSGTDSIIGRSFLIYDENGPQARGNRLACSRITSVNRRKAVIRDWFGNGDAVTITGDIELYQTSEYDTVDIEMDVQGLQNVGEYHIHMVSVEEELAFPCENSTLYDIYDVANISDGNSDKSVNAHHVKVGDLSARYGTWNDLTTVITTHNDSNIQLFGYHSILGRSFVLVVQNSDRRWACATIERGYASSEARELRAIASFHHPLGYLYGYIKMTQLVHVDGSKTDTVIEVNLHYNGNHNRNVSNNHYWLVYVNPVGHDAVIEAKLSRCTAAGYVWNPNFIQLADPINEELYFRECGPDQPYRCYAGDLSGRLGTISIGAERKVFSDPNLPLEGEQSAMGKSIVILERNHGHDKLSCANIEPDKDIIKYANIRRTPRFVLANFLTDIRKILGVPEWMLTIDNRKTKSLYAGACIQLLFHFKGPKANEIELSFSKLMRVGRLEAQVLYNPGYVSPSSSKLKISYQNCPIREADDKKRSPFTGNSSKLLESSFYMLILVISLAYL